MKNKSVIIPRNLHTYGVKVNNNEINRKSCEKVLTSYSTFAILI